MTNPIKQNLRIFVDEAGSLDIKPTSDSGGRRVSIVCAVAVRASEEEILLSLLPRDSDGNLLKSSSRLLSPYQALQFVQALLNMPSFLSMVLVDIGFDENYKVLNEVAEIANRTRGLNHKRNIRPPNLNYELLASDAIVKVLGSAWERARYEVESLDVILDSDNLSRFDSNHFRQVLTQNFLKHKLHLQVNWCRNEDQPLLNAPDIIAGVMHRRLIYGQLKEPANLLLQAGRDGRIVIQDGRTFVPLPPS